MSNSKNEFIFNSLKTDLSHVESKTGWLIAFYSIITSALITSWTIFQIWYVFLPLLAWVLLPLLILVYALKPRMVKSDKYQILYFMDIEKIDLDTISIEQFETSLKETIKIYSKIISKKYKIIHIALTITFPFILFSTWKLFF